MFTNELPTSYSKFTLAKVKEKFEFTTKEKVDFFIDILSILIYLNII